MFKQEVIHGDRRITLVLNEKNWERTMKLAKQLGRPYSATMLVRQWMDEGLERMEPKLKGKKNDTKKG